MSEAPVRISAEEIDRSTNDRFHRFGLIEWWDQSRLSRAHVLVVGAGALGNEIVKNLALLGIGHIIVVDRDRVENSNLSRSILFRACDAGQFKADVAARAAREIYPELRVQGLVSDVVHDLGLGVFRWADVVIAGLDNREARLAINRNCLRVNRPWIDGAIEQIQGCARVFMPDGPCYECTMSALDWQLLQRRRSCNLLTREEMESGRTPTTPTISSIVAGVQCQELVKLLHGMQTIQGRGWIFNGHATDSYQVDYQHNPECYSHDVLEHIEPLDCAADEWTVTELLTAVRSRFGPEAQVELARDLLEKLVCPQCRREEVLFKSLGSVRAEAVGCPACPAVRREVVVFHKLHGNEPFCDRTLRQIGIPPWDILIVRTPDRSVGLELNNDASSVLGMAAETLEELP